MNPSQLESMLTQEDEGWSRLRILLRSIPAHRLDEPTVTIEGWSPKDVMFHIGAWLAEAARQLERIREGTYRPQEDTVDERNRVWFALSRTLDVSTARAELESARVVARDALGALPTLTTDARGWFEESAWLHYAEHVLDLERWLGT
ncbi:MAG TPA: hypothetical protein VF968_03450 [Actinomycetota bacterium]